MTLIIVESPTKARTFNRILKSENNKDSYFVFATMGHIRDLPSDKISIDYKHNFKPTYHIIRNKQIVVSELKKLGEKNKEIILATDPDREGESIGYHAAYLLGFIDEKWPEANLKRNKKIKRIVFHEITAKALNDALAKPEDIRFNLVKAQQTRRILDRIVGYELSPLLWKKIGKNWLSAGRVQTVTLRLIVEREKEINSFKLDDYFQILGLFKNGELIKAKLVSKNDIAYENKFTIKLFAGDYQYSKTTINKSNVNTLKNDLITDNYRVSSVTETIQTRYPPPPYSTSLITQDAFYKHGFSSKMTMRLAQDLYERGLITYHRTDSFNLSTQFVFRAKDYISEKFGKAYALDKPRGYKTKSKLAQEAHEAIRPTKLDQNAANNHKDTKITQNHKRLYKLIFDRAVSTQMKEATIKHFTIAIGGLKGYLFESEMQQVVFDGFLRLLNPDFVEKNQKVPSCNKDDQLKLENIEALQSQTKPPPRYNEASLIKTLEEKGIGRPSTYAPIISLIQEKYYVEKENRYFIPTKLGEAISDYLSRSFPNLFNLDFTASMEDGLDRIAEGKKNLIDLLTDFNKPFHDELTIKKADISVINVEEEVKENCPKCGSPLVVRYSRFGKFMACSTYPKCKFTKPFLKFVDGRNCPEDGGRVVIRYTKSRRRFYGCENYPKCNWSSWKFNMRNYDRKN